MFSGIVSELGPPVPPRCPTVSQTTQCYKSCFAPNPHSIYSASPSQLPPPTFWTGVVTRCFLRGECGRLVNSWAATHLEAKSSQVKTRWLCTSALQQRARIWKNRRMCYFNFSRCLYFNGRKHFESLKCEITPKCSILLIQHIRHHDTSNTMYFIFY